ncbi:MAG: hypothetical protein F4181_02190 [Proteobacteria bacterium]|nr:hypothetical protein [Pseudomonadota bacterium]
MRSISCAAGIAGLAVAAGAAAHHSHASLDRNNPQTKAGVVAEYLWKVPHVYLIVDVPDENGEVVQYTVESMNPPSLARLGWSADTFRPGDPIILHGAHDRDPDRPYMGLDWAQSVDGPRMFADRRQLEAYLEETGAEPPSGSIVDAEVPPAETFPSGFWTRTVSPYREPPADMPLNECIYPGPPRMMMMPMAYNFRWEDDDTIIIDRDLWPQPRVVHMNADTAPQAEPSAWGYSTGRFEDDTLVIETTDFIDDRWGIQIGLHSSYQKHLVERYWLEENGMALKGEFTITDPGYLSEPMVIQHSWAKVADRPILQAECSMEAAWLYITAGYNEDEYEVPVTLPQQ